MDYNDYIYLVFRECEESDTKDDLWAFTDFKAALRAIADSEYDAATFTMTRVLDNPENLESDETFEIDLEYELRKAGY